MASSSKNIGLWALVRSLLFVFTVFDLFGKIKTYLDRKIGCDWRGRPISRDSVDGEPGAKPEEDLEHGAEEDPVLPKEALLDTDDDTEVNTSSQSMTRNRAQKAVLVSLPVINSTERSAASNATTSTNLPESEGVCSNSNENDSSDHCKGGGKVEEYLASIEALGATLDRILGRLGSVGDIDDCGNLLGDDLSTKMAKSLIDNLEKMVTLNADATLQQIPEVIKRINEVKSEVRDRVQYGRSGDVIMSHVDAFVQAIIRPINAFMEKLKNTTMDSEAICDSLSKKLYDVVNLRCFHLSSYKDKARLIDDFDDRKISRFNTKLQYILEQMGSYDSSKAVSEAKSIVRQMNAQYLKYVAPQLEENESESLRKKIFNPIEDHIDALVEKLQEKKEADTANTNTELTASLSAIDRDDGYHTLLKEYDSAKKLVLSNLLYDSYNEYGSVQHADVVSFFGSYGHTDPNAKLRHIGESLAKLLERISTCDVQFVKNELTKLRGSMYKQRVLDLRSLCTLRAPLVALEEKLGVKSVLEEIEEGRLTSKTTGSHLQSVLSTANATATEPNTDITTSP